MLCFFGDEGVLTPGHVAGWYGTYPVGRENGGRVHHPSCLVYKGPDDTQTQTTHLVLCANIDKDSDAEKINYFLIPVFSQAEDNRLTRYLQAMETVSVLSIIWTRHKDTMTQ